jgi:hypothetical protein
MNSILIPQSELVSSYAPLKQSIKRELAIWLSFVDAMNSAGSRNARVVADYAAKIGRSQAHLRRKWTEFRQSSGDWKVFINRAKAGAQYWNTDRLVLPQTFIEHLRTIFPANQRKCRPAWRKLIEQWRCWYRGEACPIPGYPECPPPDSHGKHPVGWSYRNLIRHRPDNYELAASRIGRASASQIRLHVFSSRVGLKVGQFIQIDDHPVNLKVNFVGQTRAMRPLLLSALDVFSACDFAFGFKPTLWDAKTQTKKGLREIDTMWLIIQILTDFGYRTDEAGTTFILEHGTANVRGDFWERLARITNASVTVDRSGKFGQASFTGLFEGAVKGNYRHKASRESLWNLLDNELGDLPGQIGKDRDHTPEENHGLERYNQRLLQACAILPPERAAQLLFPVLEWNQFVGLALDAFHRINHRTTHELEGWERAGLTTTEWRLSEQFIDWQPIEAFQSLPAEQQSVVRALLENNINLSRPAKLSPMTVFQRGRAELTRVPRVLYPDLVPQSEAREIPVKNGLFEFQDQDISPDPLRYKAVVKGEKLPSGETFLCYVNPFDPQALVACKADGSVIGECGLWDAPCRADIDAIQKKLGEAKQWESQALQKLGIRNIERATARAAMHAHNASVLGVSPVRSPGFSPSSPTHAVPMADLNALSADHTDPLTPDSSPQPQEDAYGASMDELRDI